MFNNVDASSTAAQQNDDDKKKSKKKSSGKKAADTPAKDISSALLPAQVSAK